MVPRELRLKRMRTAVLTAARLHQEETQVGGFRWRTAMVTLTYAPASEWSPRHVTQFLRAVREYLRRRGHECRYDWVLELTKAGKPHFHVLFWLPKGLTLPKPDKRGWWPHGSTRIEWVKRAAGYLAKYVSKGTEGEIPKGARLHGNGGLSAAGRAERAWWRCPKWVREHWSIEDRPCRSPGGGWMSRTTGDYLPSPWRLVEIGPGWDYVRMVWVGFG